MKNEKQSTLVAAAILALATVSGISGCERGVTNIASVPDDPWDDAPAGLAAFGDGFPNTGDPCRRLGESVLTNEWLDHTQTLVGCPGASSTAIVERFLADHGGTVVAEVAGFSVISIPN